jgi:hypothetical protein
MLLPHADRVHGYTDEGSVRHRFLHAVRRAGRDAALNSVPQRYRAMCAAIDVTTLPRWGDPEVALAWNWRKDVGRKLGEALDRDYSAATPDEFVGTPDNLRVVGNRVIVDDYKTGWIVVDPDSWQMKTYALMAARAVGAEEAETVIWTVHDGAATPASHVWSGFDLDLIADELAALARRVLEASDPDSLRLTEGEHCRYCPAKLWCPAKQAAVRMIAGLESPRPVELEELGRAWAQLRSAQDSLKRIKKSILDVARTVPIPLPNGSTLEPVVKRTERIDENRAWTVIADRFGASKADLLVKKKLTKKRVKEVFGSDARRVLDMLRAAGAIDLDEEERVEEVACLR